jgi:hypothetical protein
VLENLVVVSRKLSEGQERVRGGDVIGSKKEQVK